MIEWFNNLDATTQGLIFTGVKAIAAFTVMMTIFAYTVLAERRICAAIQDRVGPNRVGPFGLLQPAADGVKAFFKEEMTPAHVRKIFFTLAPMIALIPAILNLAVIPFGSKLGDQPMVLANLNVGILYTFGIVSLGDVSKGENAAAAGQTVAEISAPGGAHSQRGRSKKENAKPV